MKKILLGALVTALLISGAAAKDPPAPDFQRMMDLVKNKMADRAPYWRCETRIKFSCTSEGCEPAEPLLRVYVDFESDTYQRCDTSGCDNYQMVSKVDMINTIITLRDHPGASMTVSNDGKEFIEAMPVQTTIYNSFGACAPAER